MQTTPDGIALIKRYEALRLKAYKDPVGIPTIGYGHTGEDVALGQTITEEEADALLRTDLIEAETAITRAVRVPLNPNQFSALVSLTFNIGVGAFLKSTLLKKLNAGDYKGAQAQFDRWNKAGGKVLPGLVKRRNSEEEMYGWDVKELHQSKQLIAGVAGGVSAPAAGVVDTLAELQGNVSPYADAFEWGKWILIGIAVISAIVVIYIRVQDRNRGIK